MLFAVVRKMQVDHDQPQKPNRDIDKEDHSPMKVSHNQSTCYWSQHGTNQGRNGYKAHGAHQVGLVESAHNSQPADGYHHGSAAALQQAARELLLAQSSDWAFLMTTGGAAPYAEKRTRNHLHNFTRLCEMIRSGNVDKKYVDGLYAMNPIFPELDCRAFL